MEETPGGRVGKLRQWIFSTLREKGPIPFSQWMAWCLYHPQYGYYRSEEVKIGKEGDYFTSPCIHPIFGGMVAKQIAQMAELVGEEQFTIVEIGSGRGYLCQDILDWAKKRAPHFYKKLQYRLVETNPYSVEEQKKRLCPYVEEGKVNWMEEKTDGQGREPIIGCILSNELIDAFPVHQVVVDKGQLKEIYVTVHEDQLKEILGEPSDPRLLSYFEWMSLSLEEGQRAEVNLKALDWVEEVASLLRKGFVVTIDYGYPAEELYAPHRRQGTLLCYHRHQASDNPYERLGEQDITAHVNFSALVKKGEEVGLQWTGLVSQNHFLLALGVLEELESLSADLSEFESLKMRLAFLHLIEPEKGMGELFKVLIQHKGIERPRLDGLRDLNAIPWPTPPPSLSFNSGLGKIVSDQKGDR